MTKGGVATRDWRDGAIIGLTAAAIAGPLLLTTGCSHLEVWKLRQYVGPGSVEHKRIEERVTRLYSMTCAVGGRQEKRFVINAQHVALMVPDVRAGRCRAAIPYAICEVAPDEDPLKACLRLR